VNETTIMLDGSILGWGAGGISRYLRNVLVHMAQEPDLRIELFSNSRGPVASIPGVVEHHRRVKGGVLWRSTVLSSSLLRRRPDVYWLPTTFWSPYLPRPYVVTVHDLAPAIFPSSKNRTEALAFRSLYRRLVIRADHVLAVSEATAQDLRTIWSVPDERITVVPLGVSGFFAPGDNSLARSKVERRWNLAEPFAVVVGTVEERKGLDLAMEIAEISPDLKVVFAGRPGFGYERVVSRGKAAGALFLGEVSDDELLDLYRAAELMLAPSLYEGFGLTPLEAMACGCPAIVAGQAGALTQIHGDGAIVVADRDARSWSGAIHTVRSDRSRWSERGRRLASRYTWKATASDTARVLRSVAGCRNGAGS
jgi:glycosyltransferase involved in cell wall biosynthesis